MLTRIGWNKFFVFLLLWKAAFAGTKKKKKGGIVNTIQKLECTIVEQCQLCTSTDLKDIPACKKTGKREDLKCVNIAGDTRFMSQSCEYTEADEEFALVRLQVFCLLIGAVAFVSVRKQKATSASLFDRRKLQAKQEQEQARQRRATQQQKQAAGIEMASREETAPLTLDAILPVV